MGTYLVRMVLCERATDDWNLCDDFLTVHVLAVHFLSAVSVSGLWLRVELASGDSAEQIDKTDHAFVVVVLVCC